MSNKLFKNKRTAFFLLIIMLISLLSFTMVSCSKTSSLDESNFDAKISQAILEQNKGKYLEGQYACESHHIYKSESDNNKTVCYILYVYNEYNYSNKKVERVSGGCTPAVITFADDSDKYDFWEPRDGEDYQPDLDKAFPSDIDMKENILPEQLENECEQKAAEHFKK